MYFYLPEVKDRTLEEIDEMVSMTSREVIPHRWLHITRAYIGGSADARIVLSSLTCEEVQAVPVHRHWRIDG